SWAKDRKPTNKPALYSTRLGDKLVDGEGCRVVIRRLFLPDGDLFMYAALKPSRRARLAIGLNRWASASLAPTTQYPNS
ncbi:MAG TPA: hypothetical protein VK603_06290, partial [Candidatus Saccharimonadales bacterium]|nr:hypothetical protein [Candidatus Saccharimonadales bacterium]